MPRLLQSTQPFVFSETNGDGTKEVVAGDFEAFDIVIILNGAITVVPVERDKTGFYSYGATLPVNADVRVSR